MIMINVYVYINKYILHIFISMCMNGDDGDDVDYVGQFSQFHNSLPFASVRTYAKVREGVKEPIQYTGRGSTPPPP